MRVQANHAGVGFLPFLFSTLAGLAWSSFGTGNALSRISWANIKTGLRRKCMHEDGAKEQGVCCYMPDGKPRKCHIPWGVRSFAANCNRFNFCDR